MGRWHAHAAARAGARLVGVVDLDRVAATSLAGRYGSRFFASVEELLSRARPDVLHICTPLTTHEELAELAIAAGVHLLVEKPLTDRVEAAESLVAKGASHGVLVVPVHQYVFQDGVRMAARQLASLGQPVHAQAVFCSAGAGEDSEIERRGDRVAADILPHPLSVFEALWPGSMATAEWIATRPAAGELRAQTMLGHASVSVLISMRARPTRAEMWLAGARGSVEVDFFHGFAFAESGAVSRVRKVVRPYDVSARRMVAAARNLGHRALAGSPAYPGLNELVRALYRAIELGDSPPLSPESTTAVARARDRILATAGLRTVLEAEQMDPARRAPSSAAGIGT